MFSEIQTGIFGQIERAVMNLRTQSNLSEILKISLNGMEISRKKNSKFLCVLGVKLDNVKDISILQATAVNQNMIFHKPLEIFENAKQYIQSNGKRPMREV